MKRFTKTKTLAAVGDPHLGLLPPSQRKDNYCLTGIKKIISIATENNAILFTGDVFSKSQVPDELKNAILSLFIRLGIPIYTIEGNHDVSNDNPEFLHKTSLGNLSLHKSITVLKSGLIHNVEGLKVGVLPYDIKEARKFVFKEPCDLVIGHHAFEWWKDPEQSVTREQLFQYNTKLIILGHDHKQYEPITFNGITVLRPGSMLRNILIDYAITQKPSYYQISHESNAIQNWELKEIPHQAAEEVFRLEEKQELKKTIKLVGEIKKFLAATNSSSINSGLKISDILREQLQAPPDVMEFLSTLHRVAGEEF